MQQATIIRIEPNGLGRATVTLQLDMSWQEAGKMQVMSDKGSVRVEVV